MSRGTYPNKTIPELEERVWYVRGRCAQCDESSESESKLKIEEKR